MKRFISRVFALLLVCVMCAALPLSAQASIITPPAGSTHLFGITSTGFYNELRTDASGKMFATYNHVGKTIWIVGTMTHSSSRNFTVGLCHKVAPSGLFRYETAGIWTSGDDTYTYQVDRLPTDSSYLNAQTYYVYFQNTAGYGKVTGSVAVYSGRAA